LILASAKTETALTAVEASMLELLRTTSCPPLSDIAYTAAVGRRTWTYRSFAVSDESVPLTSFRFSKASKAADRDRPAIFMFPGQGSQYPRMGIDLFRWDATFREGIALCSGIFEPYLGCSLENLIYSSDQSTKEVDSRLRQTQFAQSAIFATSY